jgi:hypothetical protein
VIEQLTNLIQNRLGEIEEETGRLRSFLGAVEPTSAPKSRRRRGGRRGKRPAQFLAAVEKTPGARASDIAKAIGVSPNHAHGLGKRLVEDGKVKKVGLGYEPVGGAKS